ncbi:MAG: hypothetical protein ACYC3G_00430, partial [Minisyncoccota bacterium]
KVKLTPGIKNTEAIDLYNKYEIFVNLTPSGSMDKTIFEAMACESLVLVSNKSLEDKINNKLIFKEGNFIDLAEKLKTIFSFSIEEKEGFGKELSSYILKEHDLSLLVGRVCK